MMVQDALGLLADSPPAVFAVDMEQRIVLWNRSAERILRRKAADVLGKQCCQVLSGRSEAGGSLCSADCPAIQQARRQHVPRRDTILTQVDGATTKAFKSTHLLLAGSGTHQDQNTLVHVLDDVTEEIQAKRVVRYLRGLLSEAGPAAIVPHPPGLGLSPLQPSLTAREYEVLHLLVQGSSTEAIAQELMVAALTVRNHIRHILAKLGVHTRLEAVAAATRRGLV